MQMQKLHTSFTATTELIRIFAIGNLGTGTCNFSPNFKPDQAIIFYIEQENLFNNYVNRTSVQSSFSCNDVQVWRIYQSVLPV